MSVQALTEWIGTEGECKKWSGNSGLLTNDQQTLDDSTFKPNILYFQVLLVREGKFVLDFAEQPNM